VLESDSTIDFYVLPHISFAAITSLHPLSSCTSIPPSALQIRLFSAMKSLSAILYSLKYFIISFSISVCWLRASGLEIPMQTPWQQQTLSFSLQDHLYEAIHSKETIIENCSGPTSGHDRR
jgi:hypothetical protein